VALSASSYIVAQNSGSVAVTVRRNGGSSGVASVQYATANDTAIAGAHYTQTMGTLTWADGESTSKTVSIPVSNATPFIGTKTFRFTMQNATGSTLGTPSTSTISINGSAASGTCQQTASSTVYNGVTNPWSSDLYG